MTHIFTRFVGGQERHAIERRDADAPEVGVTFCGLRYNLRCSGVQQGRRCRECVRAIQALTPIRAARKERGRKA